MLLRRSTQDALCAGYDWRNDRKRAAGAAGLCGAGAAFALAKFSIDPLYVFTEWVPEVVVELSSIAKRFWSLNDANAAAVRYVSRNYCVLETGRGLLRWGLLALLLGAWMNGVPFFAKRVQMPEINKER